MPNMSTNPNPQGTNIDSSTSRGELTAGQIGILLIQGFTIFAGFSTLLGRIYIRSFSNALKIPETEFHLDALHYSVVSPDVAISGIGVAISSIVIVISFRWKINRSERWVLLLVGAALVCLTLYLVTWRNNDEVPEPGLGVLGIFWLFYTVGWTLGFALMISAGVSWRAEYSVSDRTSNGGRSLDWSLEAGRIISVSIQGIGGVAAITLLLLMPILQATIVGEMDARLLLRQAPLVELAVHATSSFGTLKRAGGIMATDCSLGRFRLIHVGDKFIYVRRPEASRIVPEYAGLNSGDPYQYAIPIGDVASITQILKSD